MNCDTITVEVTPAMPFAEAFETVTGLNPRNVGCKVEVFEPHIPQDVAPYISQEDGISVQPYALPTPGPVPTHNYPASYPSDHQSSGGTIHAGQAEGNALRAVLTVFGITFAITIVTSR